MKSIREWMFENGMVSEDFDKNATARYFGSSSVDVDQNLRRELKPKVERIMDMEEFRSLSKEDLLTKLKVVVSQIVAEVGSTTATSRGLAARIGDGEGSSVDKNKFARMMGSERLEVDQGLRRELRPKIERIMDMEEYRSIPKSELESKLIAVVSQLVAEMGGSTINMSSLDKRINAPEAEQDPIAQESAKLPSFLGWIENNQEGGESVSEPQHEEGEDNMDLKAVVEKRMMQMAMELESDGKGSRKDVLAAMKSVVDSAAKESEEGQGQEQGQQPPQDGQQPPPEGTEGQQPPPPQQPQVQA
jgi:ribosomal protein S13